MDFFLKLKIKNYILKTIRNGILEIFLIPFSEPIPNSIDKEMVFSPTMLIIEDCFNNFACFFFFN